VQSSTVTSLVASRQITRLDTSKTFLIEKVSHREGVSVARLSSLCPGCEISQQHPTPDIARPRLRTRKARRRDVSTSFWHSEVGYAPQLWQKG
jgi:hypothetical protein